MHSLIIPACLKARSARRHRQLATAMLTSSVAATLFGGSPVWGQVVVTVSVQAADVASGIPGICRLDVAPATETAGAVLQTSDTLVLQVLKGDSLVPSPAQLIAKVGTGQTFNLAAGAESLRVSLGARGLADQTVHVSRTEAGATPLCISVPARAYTTARNIGVTHHDLFAGGEVSTALRTGASGSAATGSLGLHTRVFTGARHYRFPFGFLPSARGFNWLSSKLSYPVALEELRTTVTVVGSTDTLFAPGRTQDYAQAVLSPLTAAKGNISSVSIMYSPQQRYGESSLRGFRFSGSVTRSVWRGTVPSTAAAAVVDTIAKDVTLFSGDARYKWVFINYTQDDGGNVFSFGMDGGITYRSVAGDIAGAANSQLRVATLGTDKRHFYGPVFGLELRLRQVTAFGDVQRLKVPKSDGSTQVENLEGWQPVIGFRFDAPMFTIGGR